MPIKHAILRIGPKPASLGVTNLAEQRQIVAKVDALMAVLDALEATLATSRTTAANLLEALVAEVTG